MRPVPLVTAPVAKTAAMPRRMKFTARTAAWWLRWGFGGYTACCRVERARVPQGQDGRGPRGKKGEGEVGGLELDMLGQTC